MADGAPPSDLTMWVGGAVLAGVGTAIGAAVRSVFTKGSADAAAAQAELKADVKSILAGLTELRTAHAVQAHDLSALMGRFAAVEVRQDKQAEAHREALGTLAARLSELESKRGRR